MRIHLTRLFVVAAGGAGVLLAGPGAAAASPAAAAHAAPAHGGWGKAAEIPGSGTLAAGGDANGNSVSCSSAGNCVAGGFYIDAEHHDQVFLAIESKGHWGKAFEIPGTPSLNGGGDADLAAVACPSAGSCTATGWYEASAGPLEAFVVSEHGGHWAKAAELRGFGTLNADDYGQVKALSCAAAGYCTAGGYTQRSGTVSTAFVLSEVTGHWGNAQRLPGMSGINHGGVAGLDALSCASPGNCAAGGSYRPSTASTHSQAWLAVQKSGHWGNAFEIAGSLNADGGAQLTAASCPAAGACVAGGYYENAAGHLERFLISQHLGHWGKAGKLPGLLTLNKGPDSQLYSLSCGSAGNCSGGGYYNNATFREFAFVSTESGGHWAAAKRVPGITSVSPGGATCPLPDCYSRPADLPPMTGKFALSYPHLLPLRRPLLAGAAGVALALAPAAASASAGTPAPRTAGQYTTIDVPGAAGTIAVGANDAGVVSGFSFGAGGIEHGFLDRNGRFTTIDVPGAADTLVTVINDRGVVPGYYLDGGGAAHGFLDRRGRITTVNAPGAGPASGQGTFLANVSDRGVIAGFFTDSGGVQHGFIDRNGRFTIINDPHAGSGPGQGTSVGYVNDAGQITGSYTQGNGDTVAFAGFPGRLGTVSDPAAPPFATLAAAINDAGIVVGEWADASGLFHGFTERHGVFTPVKDPAGAEGTNVEGISNNGIIAGFYTDAGAVNHGFELTRTR